MKALNEILSISSYKPDKGPLFDLYEITLSNVMDRAAAKELFIQRRKESDFSLNYNRLTKKGLTGILRNSFGKTTKVQQERIQLYIDFVAAKILFHLNKTTAYCKIADKILQQSERLGIYDFGLSIARSLQKYYSELASDKNKFEKYQSKVKQFNQYLNEEIELENYYTRLISKFRRNKLVAVDFEQFDYFTEIAQRNKNYLFRRYYYTLKNLKADFYNDSALFVQNTEEALTFFDSITEPLPSSVKFDFLLNLIPIYINQQDYIKVERTVNACLSLPIKGGYNWHLTLMLKAIYGIYSNKPQIALNALLNSKAHKRRFTNPVLNERWEIIEAYNKFRFSKLNNTLKSNHRTEAQKANVLVLELLFLLVNNKIDAFTKRTWQIERVIANNFNKRPFRRTKYFLRSLRCVVDGNYHPAGAARHAERHLSKMRAIKETIDLNLLDKEVIPYEMLWGEVIRILSKKINLK